MCVCACAYTDIDIDVDTDICFYSLMFLYLPYVSTKVRLEFMTYVLLHHYFTPTAGRVPEIAEGFVGKVPATLALCH